MTPRFHPLKVAEVRRETADAVSLRFEVPAELTEDYRFVQGQHLNLKLKVGAEELRRSYSICAGHTSTGWPASVPRFLRRKPKGNSDPTEVSSTRASPRRTGFTPHSSVTAPPSSCGGVRWTGPRDW